MTALVKDWDVELARDTDRDLYTYVLIALMTHRRADPSDDLLDPTYLGGWWGDSLPDVEDDLIGSRLWTLRGRSITDALALAPGMVREALQCGIEDGLYTEIDPGVSIAGPGVLSVAPALTLPSGKIAKILEPWYISV